MNETNSTESQTHPPTPSPAVAAKASGDKRVKVVFLGMLVLAAAGLYVKQLQGARWDGSGRDLQRALDQASQENRNVLVLFTSSTKGELENRLIQGPLAKNKTQIQKSGVICAEAPLSGGVNSEVAHKYRIHDIPTMLLLGPDGRELNRRDGTVAETDVPKLLLPKAKGEK